MQDQSTVQQPQLSRSEQYAAPATGEAVGASQTQAGQLPQGQFAKQQPQQPQQLSSVQPAQQAAVDPQPQAQLTLGSQQPVAAKQPQQLPAGQQPAVAAGSQTQPQVSLAAQRPAQFQQQAPVQPTIQQPSIRRQAAQLSGWSQASQQPQQFQPQQSIDAATAATQPSAIEGRVGQQAGIQSAQIPAGSKLGQGQIAGQMMGRDTTRQYVETADTGLLADTLARRLGLTSQQLAQVVPRLGVALGSQQHTVQQPAVDEQFVTQQGSMDAQYATQEGVGGPQIPVSQLR